MGWPEEPTDLGSPGHVNRGDELEALRDQIRRMSGPICGRRYVSGVVIGAGIAGVETATNIETGTGRFESGRRYKIKMKLHIQHSTTTNVAVWRARVGSVSGTQIDYFQSLVANVGTGFWWYQEFDYSPSADTVDTIVLTAQVVSGGGTVDAEAGSTTSPVYFEVWDAGHVTDVTTVT